MNILYSADAGLRRGLFLSAMSVAVASNEPVDCYIVSAACEFGGRKYISLTQDYARCLERTIADKNPGSTVTLINITDIFMGETPGANLATRFTPMCMLRLYADLIEEIPERILYLDCDVLCCRDFSDFYRIDLESYDLAGAPDRYGRFFLSKPLWKHNYLNSGVLLFNMRRIRENGLFAECRKKCSKERMYFPDQSAINALAKKRIVPRRYNEQGKIRRDTVFKHFSTFFSFFPYFHSVTVKPWDKARLHDILGIHEFDSLIYEYEKEYEKYENRNSDILLCR